MLAISGCCTLRKSVARAGRFPSAWPGVNAFQVHRGGHALQRSQGYTHSPDGRAQNRAAHKNSMYVVDACCKVKRRLKDASLPTRLSPRSLKKKVTSIFRGASLTISINKLFLPITKENHEKQNIHLRCHRMHGRNIFSRLWKNTRTEY